MTQGGDSAKTEGARARVLNQATAANARLRAIVAAPCMHPVPTYGERGAQDWRQRLVTDLSSTDVVLDVGKSSRDLFPAICERAARVDTIDINQFDGYPDLICDLCQDIPAEFHEAYDVIICLSVLEALYDPQAGINNLKRLLKPGGRLYLYAPFISKYEAPRDLQYQDYFRFSKDGFAYLLRDFSTIDIFAVRGQYSTMAHLLPNWKSWIEGRFGAGLSRFLDRFADARSNLIQASGYNIIAVK